MHRMQVTIGKKQTLVYADIGPRSFKRQPNKTVPLDDDRVEYAQVNQVYKTKKAQGIV